MKHDKREDILNAAMILLAEQGFHGAPMAKIAARAGVGAGTIYHYFENRDELIRAIHRMVFDDFSAHLMAQYPIGRPVRECFFYIGKTIIDYLVRYPVKFKYNEQFHNSPFGLEMRRDRLLNKADSFDFARDLYEQGRAEQVIKPVPIFVFFDLAFAPIIWAIRDHHSGLIILDEGLREAIVSSCWNSIRL